MFTILIIILALGITCYAIYDDVQKTINEDKIFIISEENKVLTGIVFSNNFEDRNYLTYEEIDEYSGFLESKKLQLILDEKYLFINLDISNINNATTLNYSNNLIDNEEIKNIMLSESPEKLMIRMNDVMGNKNNYEEITTLDEMVRYKMDLSGLLIKEMVTSDEGLYDKIDIYPERITMKIMDELPIIFNLIKNKMDDEDLQID